MADFSWGNIVDSIGGGIGAALRDTAGMTSQSNAMKRRSAMAAAETADAVNQKREDAEEAAMNKKLKQQFDAMIGEDEHLKLGLIKLEEQYGNFSVKTPQGIGELFGFDREAKKRRDQMVQRQQMQDNLVRQQIIREGKKG
jgi:regulator of replication initiation timing